MKNFTTLPLNALLLMSMSHIAWTCEALPLPIKQWLDESVGLLGTMFLEEFPDRTSINRQSTAANTRIQNLLLARAELLAQEKDFTKDLKGQFVRLRKESQPHNYRGESPAQTESSHEQAAFHTIAGTAEIICGESKWQESLQEHFTRIGQH